MAHITTLNLTDLARITAGWPAVPTRERLVTASKTHQELLQQLARYQGHELQPNPPKPFTFTDAQGTEHTFDTAHEETLPVVPKDQDQGDAVALHDCYQAVRFAEAANQLFRSMNFKAYRGGEDGATKAPGFTPEQWYSAALVQFLTAMGTYGESDNCIGLTWQRWSETLPDKTELIMTKLSRHRDWMGLNLALKDTSRIRFMVYPYHGNPRVPGFAVGYPGEEPLGRQRHKPFPKGQASILRDLLMHHGADECRWIPRRPG